MYKCMHTSDDGFTLSLSPTLSLTFPHPYFLSRSIALSLALLHSRSLALCREVSTKRPTGFSHALSLSRFFSHSFSLALSHSHSLSLSLALSLSPSRPYALALSLFLFSQPGRHRWKLSIGDARASERATAATTARMLGACRHTRGNRFLNYDLATLKADSVLSL